MTSVVISFPLFDKIEVIEDKRHSLYGALTGKNSPVPGDIKWNFTKFLKRYESATTPDSPEVIEAIDAAITTK